MRVLYLYFHPLEGSFHAAFRDTGAAALRANGYEVYLSAPACAKALLQHIRQVVRISTYGRDRWRAFVVGNPPKRMVTRYLRWFVARSARIRYLSLYHMNVATEAHRKAFLARVVRELSAVG
jgi:putative NADPH-quinone reductase